MPVMVISEILSIQYLIFFLVFIFPPFNSLTLNFSNIGPQNQNRDIVTEGNGAYISNDGIQLTPDRTGEAGRATYIRPLHLWDNASGQLADFTTNFSFVIDSDGVRSYADGLTFFLAENNSLISTGGSFGLPVNTTAFVATNQFVAVEFDTYWNHWDPVDSMNSSIGEHAAISISSLISVKAVKWWSNITYGRENEAWIKYDSNSKNLSVVFTGFQNNTVVEQSGLHYAVDLRDELPEWVIFGFSASTGGLFENNNVKSWSFSSSVLHVDETLDPPTGSPTPELPAPNSGNGNDKAGLVVGVSVGSCVLVIGLVLIAFYLFKEKRENKVEELGFDVGMDSEFEMGSGPKRFSYHELFQATNNFAEEEKLGEGGFGGVYRGFFKELSSYVAVKRVSKSSKQGIKEYASEVRIISQLRHRNLVQLIGWCHENSELLLVYDFMENGSLDTHLFKSRSLLIWGVRYKIAQGLASALLYLHEEWVQCVLHRDIKSSNVMLDSNFNAKLGDFGLAKLVDHDKGSQTTVLAGTMGYMAPECYNSGRATKESDVFSFGVVALEIACGRKPVELRVEEHQMGLVEWVWELYGMGKLLEATDPKLGDDFNDQEMEYLMIVGLWCAHPDSNLRPSIKQAIHVLNFQAPLPLLPSKMPVATYYASPTSSLAALYRAVMLGESKTHSSSYLYNTIP